MKVSFEMPLIKISIYNIKNWHSRKNFYRYVRNKVLYDLCFYSAFNHVDQFLRVLSDTALVKIILTTILAILSWIKNSSTVYHTLSIVTEVEPQPPCRRYQPYVAQWPPTGKSQWPDSVQAKRNFAHKHAMAEWNKQRGLKVSKEWWEGDN